MSRTQHQRELRWDRELDELSRLVRSRTLNREQRADVRARLETLSAEIDSDALRRPAHYELWSRWRIVRFFQQRRAFGRYGR